MSDAERVTIKAFDKVDEAKDAEQLLLERGLSPEVVSRKGKKLKVAAEWEDQARALLANEAPPTFVNSVRDSVHAATNGVHDSASKVVDVAQETADAVTDTVQNVTRAVADRAGTAVDAASEKVGQLAETVRQYGGGEDASAVQRSAAQTTANLLDRTAYYLQKGDVNLVLDDLRDVIRRHPGRSLLLGLGLGYLARTTLADEDTRTQQQS